VLWDRYEAKKMLASREVGAILRARRIINTLNEQNPETIFGATFSMPQ